jgi:transcriptional regulator GlxA family with amidase domain
VALFVCSKWPLLVAGINQMKGWMNAPSFTDSRPPADVVRTIGIIGFDGVAALDLIGPLETFKAARAYHPTNTCYDVVLLGLSRRKFVSESGIVFKADTLLETVPSLDTVIIPGGSVQRLLDISEEVSLWLRARTGAFRRIASINTGIYALAQGGFLNSRQVTTHWKSARDLAKRFPQLHVSDTASFIKDGPFYTCGGGTAGMEMTLALIEEDYGSAVALEVAREFVIRLRLPGSQRALIHPPQNERQASERLAELPAWILGHLHENLSVGSLAERACVCPRHFSRLFKAVFHTTPADFVEQLRLGEARQRLALPRASIKSIATSVGFKSADAFRRAFERQIGLTPSKFRMRFEPGRRSPLRGRENPLSPRVRRHNWSAENPFASALK